LGVKDRLRDLLEDKRFSSKMRLPSVTVAPNDRVGSDATVKNVWDSTGWWRHVVQGQGRDNVNTTFGTERAGRNIVLCVNIDGFKPFKRVSTSMTPFVYQVLNLPEDLRYRDGFLILAALHPGRKKPTNFSTHLRVLVDELLELWTDGIEFNDPELDGAPNVARVKLLFTVADYPAHCDNNCQQGASAYNGCIKCTIKVRYNDHASACRRMLDHTDGCLTTQTNAFVRSLTLSHWVSFLAGGTQGGQARFALR
jgi:hypothetical protein